MKRNHSKLIGSGLVAITLSALGVSGLVGAQNGVPTVTYMYTGGIPKDYLKVQDAMNKILTTNKANVQIKLQPTDWGDFDQKTKLMFASGEKCDIVFTAPWINNYYQNVAQGNLLPLEDLLKKSAPRLYRSVPASAWDATKIGGKIYGVINQQIFARIYGFNFRKDLAEKYKLDLGAVNTLEDLEPFLARMKAGEAAGFTPLDLGGPTWNAEYNGFDPLVEDIGVLVKNTDKSLKVVSAIESPEFAKAVALQYKWAKAGYYNVQGDPDLAANFRAGKYGGKINLVAKPGVEFEFKNAYGFDAVAKSLTKPVLTTNGVIATMNGICRTSANPEAAMRFLEQLNTDPLLYNTLAKGVQDTHWVWADRAKKLVAPTANSAAYNPNTDWMFGNTFNAYYLSKDLVGTNEATKKINQQAKASVALGFAFDSTKVKSEVAQVQAVFKEKVQPIIAGQVDPTTALPEAIKAIKAAKMDVVVAEAQRQLTEWSKTK